MQTGREVSYFLLKKGLALAGGAEGEGGGWRGREEEMH